MTDRELLLHKSKFVIMNGFDFRMLNGIVVAFEQKFGGVRIEKPSLEEAIEAAFLYVSGLVYNGILSGQLTTEQASAFFPTKYEMKHFMESGRLVC